MSDTQGSVDVNLDNALELLKRSLLERNRHLVGLADVVDEYANVEAVDGLVESFVRVVVTSGEVD